MSRSFSWYAHRLRGMSTGEVAGRARDVAVRRVWAHARVGVGESASAPPGTRPSRSLGASVAAGVREQVPTATRDAVRSAADGILSGSWSVLGTPRPDIRDPDWFRDPVTGRSAPHDCLSFAIDHRDEEVTGNVKSVWELSRHHHLTVLASAYWLTGEEEYAEVVDAQLRSWWHQNPFLTGVHWTSGIETGVRLMSWVWIRRLLDDWPKVGDLFETNDAALQQLWWHQRFLAAFPSRGSSGNNHAVAEAAGLLAASSALPWFAESDEWRVVGTKRLERELDANTFPSGVNRELATDYHRFVTELGLVAAAEAQAAGHPLSDATWNLLTRSLDAAAALLDVRGRAPRQGDGDEGRALVVDAPDADPWGLLLGAGAALVGPAPWWPEPAPGVVGAVLEAISPRRAPTAPRPPDAPRSFEDAGIYILRTPEEDGPEIWCRCDGGPHGFLSIAAHAHADALSVEVRHDGVDLLVDPGTYCYHGEPEWRSYFRSTRAHNTLQIDGLPQSVETGPFMWRDHAVTEVLDALVGSLDDQCWVARHTGYTRLHPSVLHTRWVRLESRARCLFIVDAVSCDGEHEVELALHLGPGVDVELAAGSESPEARLQWQGAAGTHEAWLELPEELSWTAHRGEVDPVLGWYSPRFGERTPTWTLLGRGAVQGTLGVTTRLVLPHPEHERGRDG